MCLGWLGWGKSAWIENKARCSHGFPLEKPSWIQGLMCFLLFGFGSFVTNPHTLSWLLAPGSYLDVLQISESPNSVPSSVQGPHRSHSLSPEGVNAF